MATAGKILASLEGQGRVTRRRVTPQGGKATPDRWTLVPDPLADRDRAEPEPPPTAAEVAVDEPADTTGSPAEASSVEAVPPAADTPDPDQPAGRAGGSGPRLRYGALRALVHAWLAERPGQEFTPTRIGKELGRSAGAVGNALATMTDQGEVTQTSSKPRMYALAEGGDQAGATR